MTHPRQVKHLIESIGGTVEEMHALPDGSGFATASLPLPGDHWLTRKGNNLAPPMPLRLGTDHPEHKRMVQAIWAAAKYALRASTANGKEDYDPDAVCQNMVVGLIGYHTSDGLSQLDDWSNPSPVPPLFDPKFPEQSDDD